MDLIAIRPTFCLNKFYRDLVITFRFVTLYLLNSELKLKGTWLRH